MNASELIWYEYRAELLRFVVSRIRDKDTAEDLVHEVLLKVHNHQGDISELDSIRAWIYRITRNTLIDHYRRTRPFDPLPDSLAEEQAEQSEMIERELALCLKPLLATLSDKYRAPLVKHDIEGIKQHAIAEEMGISLSGMKSRIQRGRNMLKDALLNCCRIELDYRGSIEDVDMKGSCDHCQR